jgi:hypothetical protein
VGVSSTVANRLSCPKESSTVSRCSAVVGKMGAKKAADAFSAASVS